VQDANGWKHVIVTENGIKRRIGVNSIHIPNQTDIVFKYIFGGLYITHPCPAMDFWIYRHRLGHRISVKEYKIKFNVKIKTCNY